MNLVRYVEEFAKVANVDSIKNDFENVVSVQVDDFELFFAYNASLNAIMLHASVGMHDGSKESLACLLAMNNFFSETKGICLGIDGDVITAQQNIFVMHDEADALTTESFLQQCEAFMHGLAVLIPLFVDTQAFAKHAAQANDGAKEVSKGVLHNQGIRV